MNLLVSIGGLTVICGLLAVALSASPVEIRRVEFLSGGEKIVGSLYVPTDGSKRHPGVIVEGPQTNVKEMVPAIYAERLANAGYVVLTFDHRTFGESAGNVRGFENPAMKVEDIRNALAFLKTRPEVNPNAIGLLGVCSGAGYSAKAAASEPGLGAFVTIAGFYHDPSVFKAWLGKDYDSRVALGSAARLKFEKTGVVDYITNVDSQDSKVAMPGKEAYEYYGTSRNRGSRWENRSATMFFEPFLQFNSIDAGREIIAPTLVIHSDAALVPDGAKRFYQSLPGEKKLHWMTTTQHIDFYDVPKYVDEAAAEAIMWLNSHLRSTQLPASGPNLAGGAQ